MIHKIVAFIFCFVLSQTSNSQESIIHYTTTSGLPHDITYGIFQDKNGFIWIGTDDGLVKFDGQDFKIFSTDDGLRNNFVIDIVEDTFGDIIFATWGGGLHAIRNDKVIPLTINDDATEKINNLQLWNNNIIVKNATGNLLYKKTKDGYLKKLLLVENYKIKEVPYSKKTTGDNFITVLDNSLFFINDIKSTYNFSSEKKGIFGFNTQKQHSFTSRFNNQVVNSLSKLDDDTYAITILDSLFFFKNGRLTASYDLNFSDDLNMVSCIKKISAQEYLVLVSNSKGFKNAYIFSNYFKDRIDLKKKLKISTSVSDILIDHEKNIWLTTYGDGVFCINRQTKPIKTLSKQKIAEPFTVDITEINKTKYILSLNYLTYFTDTLNIHKYKLSGIGKKITPANNNEIIISATSINKDLKHETINEINAFNVINLQEKGFVYVTDYINIDYYNARIPANKKIIYDAAFCKDTLWFGTNVGMFYYNIKQKKLDKKNIGNKRLLSDYIKKFASVGNVFWIATSKGLCKYENNKITNYTEENGLISNRINTMIVDHNKQLWIGTNSGISVYRSPNFINLSTNQGLLSPFINSIYEDSDNKIWIGSDKGVSIFDNNSVIKLEKPPLIYVKQSMADFTYAVLSFNRSKSLIVQYKLNNSKWITLNSVKGNLNFNEQEKGDYTLMLRAKKLDGVWGYSQQYKFRIAIPWYKDIIYSTIFIIFVTLVINFIILQQLRKAKKRNLDLKNAIEKQNQLQKELSTVRTNIAQDFHDDLGNKLARISIISNLALGEISHENEKLKTKIKQIENDTNYLYKGTKDFIFSLKDDSNYLEELVTYLSDFGEELFTGSAIKFIVEKSIENNCQLPYYWSKQLIFIFKEALTNAYKHSKCDTLVFSFSYKNEVLTISCSDNGEGFPENYKASNGLTNMKKRAEKIGGMLFVNSDNTGTLIRFSGKTT